MSATPDLLDELETTQSLWIEFSSDQIQQAWPEAGRYSHRAACWNAFVNQLCLNGFIPWLETILPPSDRAVSVWPGVATQPSVWEALNGAAITFGETRWILIPTETVEPDGFFVPREWVDLPSFAGDYYLSLQVEIDEERDAGWMRLLGYTTHEKLKRRNRYDPIFATYSIETSDAIDDFATLWLAQKLRPHRRVELATLPVLSGDRAECLLQQLAQTAGYSPRLRQTLDITFEEWGALLENDRWRQRLHQLRLEAVQSRMQLDATQLDTTHYRPSAINLARWLQHLGREAGDRLDGGWQTLEEVVATLSDHHPSFACTYRSAAVWGNDASLPAIPFITQLLRSHRDRETQLSAMDLLGRIAYGNSEAIEALTEIRQNTQNDDVRRQAAVSLGQIDPSNPQAGMRKCKILDLNLQLDKKQVTLIMTLMPQVDGKTNVHLRVYPVGLTYLPPHLQLTVVDDRDRVFLETESRQADNWIQLEFNGDSGDYFGLKLGTQSETFFQSFNF